MAAVRYKNLKTRKVATFATPIPRLDRSKGWRRVEAAEPAKPKVEDKPEGKPAS